MSFVFSQYGSSLFSTSLSSALAFFLRSLAASETSLPAFCALSLISLPAFWASALSSLPFFSALSPSSLPFFSAFLAPLLTSASRSFSTFSHLVVSMGTGVDAGATLRALEVSGSACLS